MNGHPQRRESKTKGVRWRALVFVDADHGGPRWETHGTFDLKREAEERITKVLDAYYRGTYRKPSRLTVAGLYAKWVEASSPEWSANTIRHHGMNWTHHIEDVLGDELAEWLAKDTVAMWQADLIRAGCAPKSVLSYRGTLHAMYVWAMSVDLVSVNPVAAVKAPRVDRAEHDALTVAEMRSYLAALKGTRLWPGLLLGAGGGLRRGEFLAMRWSRVKSGGVVVDRRTGNLTGRTRDTLTFGPPKARKGSARSRFVPLPNAVLAELASLKAERMAKWVSSGMKWSDEALVCCGANGQPIIPDGFTHELQRICRRRGLTHTHPHAFRHGFVESMLAAGERIDVVQATAGHAHASTTQGVYAHVTESAQVQAAGRYGALWDGPSGGIGDHSEAIAAVVDELALRRACK